MNRPSDERLISTVKSLQRFLYIINPPPPSTSNLGFFLMSLFLEFEDRVSDSFKKIKPFFFFLQQILCLKKVWSFTIWSVWIQSVPIWLVPLKRNSSCCSVLISPSNIFSFVFGRTIGQLYFQNLKSFDLNLVSDFYQNGDELLTDL